MSDFLPVAAVIAHHVRHQTWTGSWLAAYASAEPMEPGTIRVAEGARCAACGHAFLPGEGGHPNPTQGSATFNDAYSMCGKASEPICSGCAATWGKRFLMDLSKCIVTMDGVYGLASNDDRAWWLNNPPEPPYVMVCGLAKQQHTYWRTPVSWSKELMVLRVGTHVGTIRRRRVLDALPLGAEVVAKAQEYELMLQAHGGAPARRGRGRPVGSLTSGVTPHPFMRLDRELVSVNHMTLKANVRRYLESDQATPRERSLCELNEIEGWALAALANSKEPRTRRPDPIATPNLPIPVVV